MENKKLILIMVFVIVLGLGMIGYGLLSPEDEKSPDQGASGSASNEPGQVVQQGTRQEYIRYDEGQGGVQVTAILLTHEYLKATGRDGLADSFDPEKDLVFEIAMSTHMGDLRKYPILKKAVLLVNGEAKKPTEWKLTADDSHHPIGLLKFGKIAQEIEGQPETAIDLNLPDLKGVSERKFVWSLQRS